MVTQNKIGYLLIWTSILAFYVYEFWRHDSKFNRYSESVTTLSMQNIPKKILSHTYTQVHNKYIIIVVNNKCNEQNSTLEKSSSIDVFTVDGEALSEKIT